jgi:hypothetical protein
MNKAERQALIATPLIILLGVAIAWAGSQGGASANTLPIFALCAGLSFLSRCRAHAQRGP